MTKSRENEKEQQGAPHDVQRPPVLAFDEPALGNLDTLFAGIEAHIAKDDSFFGRLRQRALGFRVGVAIAVVASFVFFGAILFPRSDLGVYVRSRLMLDVSLLGALIAGSCVAAFWPLHRPALPRSFHVTLQLAALASVVLLALFPGLHDPAQATVQEVLLDGLACASRGLVVGACVFGLARVLDRGAEGGAWAAAALGGLAANLALLLVCADDWPVHRLVGHVTVSFVFTAAVTSGVIVRRGS